MQSRKALHATFLPSSTLPISSRTLFWRIGGKYMWSSNEQGPFAKDIRRNANLYLLIALLAAVGAALVLVPRSRAQGTSVHAQAPPAQSNAKRKKLRNFDAQILANANELLEDGRNT